MVKKKEDLITNSVLGGDKKQTYFPVVRTFPIVRSVDSTVVQLQSRFPTLIFTIVCFYDLQIHIKTYRRLD